jgi:peptide/nickel transport system permease protein
MDEVARVPRVAIPARLWFGGIIFALLVATALGAGVIAPHDPLNQDLLNALAPPFWRDGAAPGFLLGTDSLGRDVLSRLVYGARVALIVAVVAASLAAILGTALGLAAGYFGGAVDSAISRLVEIWMSFPAVLLSIVLVAVIGSGLTAVIVAIVVVDWTRFCRVVRAEVLVQKTQDYVASARTIGMGSGATLWREIMPNVMPLLIVLLTLEMGIAVIVETILSFVGLSVSSDMPTWGGMIAEGRVYIHQAWSLMALPLLCVIVVVLGFNALGDGLREALDPVMRR